MSFRLTPDGQRYLRMGAGGREPVPFHLRWLLPWILGRCERAWIAVNIVSIIAVSALTAALALQHGATEMQAGLAALLLLGLPSIRFASSRPILVDMPGLALALGAAVLAPISLPGAIGLALLGAAVSEKAPVWAAIFALNPVLLLGLVAPAARALLVKRGEVRADDPLAWTLDPLRAGLRGHAGSWRDPLAMILPWGACLIVLAEEPSAWLLLALAVGYAQLLVATDTVRLYQQAAPVVCVTAALMIPSGWEIPLVLAHWFNPLGGAGL